MGLDAKLHVLYGYKLKGHKITDMINKHDNDDCELYDNLANGMDGLTFVDDTMCGMYEYIGLNLYSSSSDYGEENHFGLSMKDIKELCDDEKLDNLIQTKLPFIVGNLYDVCGLMENELPQLWIFKQVW